MYRQLISLHIKRYFSERNSESDSYTKQQNINEKLSNKFFTLILLEIKDRDIFSCKKDEDPFDLVIAFLFGIYIIEIMS